MISHSFVKQVLVWVSLCTCLLTFYTTSDLATFSSTSILFMANNIISCLDKDYKGKEKIFKITTLLVQIEFILIAVIFIFGNSLGKFNFSDNIISYIMVAVKVIIALVAIAGVVILSILSGTVDTLQDLQSKRIARKIVRSSNDDYFEEMEKEKITTSYRVVNILQILLIKEEGRNKDDTTSFLNNFYNNLVYIYDNSNLCLLGKKRYSF